MSRLIESALMDLETDAKPSFVSDHYYIPESTLRRKSKKKKADIDDQRPGLNPVLGKDVEDDICRWALGMQRSGSLMSSWVHCLRRLTIVELV